MTAKTTQPPASPADEGESLFEWPLTPEVRTMGAGELLDSLYETIHRLNRCRQWDRTLLLPRFGDVVVDRDRRTISARCMWKRKPAYRLDGEGGAQ
ncbi:hypothetical protein [Bifidobacterium samirii]|uniref:Uncharacterized protein n=1 Tax=Bifidobacterium samirii TaxID=2306974 RepID=A0A430FJP3_9BIFI|nr:hypothetical protein [Bifidobacterium samirii]RSX53002.1 hypothetical protein D2E24_1673 [Bifidobacterium samirii]